MRSVRLCLPAVFLVLLGGCSVAPDVSVRVTIADGQVIEVPLTTMPPPPTDGIVTIENFQFAPFDMGKDKPKAITFTYVVRLADGSKPANLLVEDFTEQPVLPILQDPKPLLVREHFVGGASRPFAPQDEHVKWILNLDNAVRIYRFTVKLADGSTHVLLKPVFVPAQMKSFLWTQLGVKP